MTIKDWLCGHQEETHPKPPQPLATEVAAREYAYLWQPKNLAEQERRLKQGRALFADMSRFGWRARQSLDDFNDQFIVPELIKVFVREYVMPDVIKESLLRTAEEKCPGTSDLEPAPRADS